MLLPKISVVLFSFNQAQFIEEAIRSVLSQEYANLDFIIFDAGSSDGSLEVIGKYSDRINLIQGEPPSDKGQSVKELLRRATGEIMAWIKPQDRYLPWTFSLVAEFFSVLPKVEWLVSSTRLIFDNRGIACHRQPLIVKKGILLAQESAFWRRSLWKRAADTSNEQPDIMNYRGPRFFFRKSLILHATEIPLAASIDNHQADLVFISAYKKIEYDPKINNWVCGNARNGIIYKFKFFARKVLILLKLILTDDNKIS